MRRSITILLLLVLVLMEVKAQVLPFCLSKGSGTFRFGIVAGDESRWLDECNLKKTGDRIYTIKDALLDKGEVRLVICPLADTKGFVMEVSGSRLPENISLPKEIWNMIRMNVLSAASYMHQVKAAHS